MQKLIKSSLFILMFIAITGFSKSYSQKLIFCDSITGNKLIGQSNEFNIDNVNRIVSILLYNGDVPFTTSKLVMQFYELTNDTVETYLSKFDINVPPNSKYYVGRVPFLSPNKYKIKFYSDANKLLADEKLTITAKKQPTGNAGFAVVLNEIIGFYPSNFKNIIGSPSAGVGMFQSWSSNENLPGYEYCWIYAEGIPKYYDFYNFESELIETNDSTEALNKYAEVAKIINSARFNCCVFKMEEELDYKNKENRKKTIIWYPSLVNLGKDKKFAEMPLQLLFTYPDISNTKYKVKFRIGFNDAAEKMLYSVKHSNLGK